MAHRGVRRSRNLTNCDIFATRRGGWFYSQTAKPEAPIWAVKYQSDATAKRGDVLIICRGINPETFINQYDVSFRARHSTPMDRRSTAVRPPFDRRWTAVGPPFSRRRTALRSPLRPPTSTCLPRRTARQTARYAGRGAASNTPLSWLQRTPLWAPRVMSLHEVEGGRKTHAATTSVGAFALGLCCTPHPGRSARTVSTAFSQNAGLPARNLMLKCWA